MMIAGGCCGSGLSGLTRVTRFDRDGNSVGMPSLNTGRVYPACGRYENSDGEQVFSEH